MNICYIITIICVLLIIGYFVNTPENFAIDLEAISNIGSLFNLDQMKLTNLNVAQNANIGQNISENVNVAQNLTVGSFNLIPRGCIIAWYGDSIPPGWLLCNGDSGTPDLTSRFIVGAGNGKGLSNYNKNATGGNESVVMSVDQMPAHTHSGPSFDGNNSCVCKGGSCACGIGLGGTGTSGFNRPFPILPPYYALAYIMKS
jgi:hypothetical protein